MPITLHWYNPEQTILYFAITAKWTWQDVHQVHRTAVHYLDQVHHHVDLVFDAQDAQKLPNMNVHELEKIAKSPLVTHPNFYRLYIINANPYMRSGINVFCSLYPRIGNKFRIINHIHELVREIPMP